MKTSEILNYFELLAPFNLAQNWDNVGLLIGEYSRDVQRVLISLDATENTVNYALQHGYDLILTHHPLIFRPLKSITNPLILKMIESHLSLISLHTNFDAAVGGVNYALAEALDLTVEGNLGEAEAGALGLLCTIVNPMSLKDLGMMVKAKLQIPGLKLWTAGKSMESEISRIAICGGAGGSILPHAESQADVFISGDINYHSFLDSRIPIIDAGHFYTEFPALKKLQHAIHILGLPAEILPQEQHEWVQNIRFLG